MPVVIKDVLVLDAVGSKCVEILIAHGFNVTKMSAPSEIRLMEVIDNYDALIVQSASLITLNVIRFASNMKVIISASAYFSNIDIYAAMTRSIGVLNSPRSSTISASEFTCGLLMALARHLVTATAAYRSGTFNRSMYVGNELSGRTLALIGLSDVAKEVGIRMHAFGMRVISSDEYISDEECARFHITNMRMKKLWPEADYIALFVPPLTTDRNHISADILARCKKGVNLIILGHIGPYQAREIHNGLMSGQIGSVALDLYDDNNDSDIFKLALFQHPSVILTRNLATQTEECVELGGQEAAEQLVNLCYPGTYPTPLSIVVRSSCMPAAPQQPSSI